jgi:hypothetical protein
LKALWHCRESGDKAQNHQNPIAIYVLLILEGFVNFTIMSVLGLISKINFDFTEKSQAIMEAFS